MFDEWTKTLLVRFGWKYLWMSTQYFQKTFLLTLGKLASEVKAFADTGIDWFQRVKPRDFTYWKPNVFVFIFLIFGENGILDLRPKYYLLVVFIAYYCLLWAIVF